MNQETRVNTTPSGTLFLDRDGVINRQKEGGYILHPDEFVFYEQVPEALSRLAARFKRIILVTNQRGIGKGLMTPADLEAIHRKMLAGIEKAGGRIDDIFYCSDVHAESPDRKPNPGMGLAAKSKYPDLDFSTSVMVGNTTSDMRFGRNLGMRTVFITSTSPAPEETGLADETYESLWRFSLSC